jgi:urate oxidase / 2-oxo-4-hydroxy-4-carboxy-5-ureidoimidazoline decarboxylase
VKVERFASGWKRNYYGKGDVTVYRLHRDGAVPEGCCPVFGANVIMLLYGDAFWPTYTTGDNTNLVATDSMKNFIQRETLNYTGFHLESYCRFLCDKFLATYPHTAGAQVSASEIPYSSVAESAMAFAPAGPDRAFARVEMSRSADGLEVVEARSGIRGFRLLRLGGSAFHGFVRDQYTTLPDIKNRPLHMWLDVEWSYTNFEAAFRDGATSQKAAAKSVRRIVHDVFAGFESGSIQEVIYQIGCRVLEDIAAISQIDLEANNRTWDTIVEQGDLMGVYTDSRPPYGCLGLSLRR